MAHGDCAPARNCSQSNGTRLLCTGVGGGGLSGGPSAGRLRSRAFSDSLEPADPLFIGTPLLGRRQFIEPPLEPVEDIRDRPLQLATLIEPATRFLLRLFQF